MYVSLMGFGARLDTPRENGWQEDQSSGDDDDDDDDEGWVEDDGAAIENASDEESAGEEEEDDAALARRLQNIEDRENYRRLLELTGAGGAQPCPIYLYYFHAFRIFGFKVGTRHR